MFSFQNCPPKTVILEHWHQNWKKWIDGETDRLVMEAGGRDITPFSDWFSMTPQLYNRPFSCFNFPFSWSLTSLCKSHHHTHLLPQMFEVPAQYFSGGSKCFEILGPNLERLRWSHLKDYVEKSNQRHWHMSAGWILFNMVLYKTLVMDIWSEAVVKVWHLFNLWKHEYLTNSFCLDTVQWFREWTIDHWHRLCSALKAWAFIFSRARIKC